MPSAQFLHSSLYVATFTQQNSCIDVTTLIETPCISTLCFPVQFALSTALQIQYVVIFSRHTFRHTKTSQLVPTLHLVGHSSSNRKTHKQCCLNSLPLAEHNRQHRCTKCSRVTLHHCGAISPEVAQSAFLAPGWRRPPARATAGSAVRRVPRRRARIFPRGPWW